MVSCRVARRSLFFMLGHLFINLMLLFAIMHQSDGFGETKESAN
jgi:hypothetical protein